MSLHEAEKRRIKRRESGSDDRRDDDERTGSRDVPNGVFLVAVFAFLGGAVDLFVGLAMLPTPFLVFGVLIATIGGLKCWAAVGLVRLRARGAGLTVLLYGAGALVDGVRLIVAVGSGGSTGEPAAGILLALVVIGYLLLRMDHFE